MNAQELHDLTPDQLREKLAEMKKESFNLRFQAATGSLENPAQIRVARRNAARVKTRSTPMPKRILTGTVTSDANTQTVTVAVERRFTHPVLKKTIRRSKKYRAHDENESFKVGDSVRIIECAPRSKTKRWEVITA